MNDKGYKLTVGLEIHAELKTRTKMFCACKNDPDEKRPNINVCPICMGHPGTLPVINKEAVRHVLRVGAALKGKQASFTEFDRKNYFYPDIPKGYQISQYAYPLVQGGSLCGVDVTRVHLEEDTARSSHEGSNYSLVDFNRAGVPLMELVTEPVIHSPEEAAIFAEELQLLLRTLGAGEANMEKGEMRVEANISVSKTDVFGTKVEVKNLNSFRAVEKAIRFEVKRHIEALERGEKIIQETRGFNEANDSTFSQRLKESSHDYRYFPDPDLPKIILDEIPDLARQEILDSLPELPDEKRKSMEGLALKSEDIEMILRDAALERYFKEVMVLVKNPEERAIAINYLTSDITGIRKDVGDKIFVQITPAHLQELASYVVDGKLSSRGVKNIIDHIKNGEEGSVGDILIKYDLVQKSDTSALKQIVDEVLEGSPAVVEDYKKGKQASLQYLIGQGMKISKGSANPELLKKEILSRLA